MIARLITWAAGPVGKWVLIALVFAGWTVFNRVDAAREARAECQLGQVEAALAAEQDRAERAEQIAAEARERADQAQAEMAELEGARDAILEELEDQGDQCDLPDDLRERLRGIQ